MLRVRTPDSLPDSIHCRVGPVADALFRLAVLVICPLLCEHVLQRRAQAAATQAAVHQRSGAARTGGLVHGNCSVVLMESQEVADVVVMVVLPGSAKKTLEVDGPHRKW